MKTRKIISLIGSSAVLLLAPVAGSYADNKTGLYVGGSWGAYSVDDSRLDDNNDVLKGFIGDQVNRWFGAEVQWTDFNRLNNDDGDRFEGDGLGLAAVLSAPIGDRSALFAKAGNFWWDSDSSFAGSQRDQDGSDPFWGAGIKLGLTDHVGLRLEWERYDVSDIELDTTSVGAQFNF